MDYTQHKPNDRSHTGRGGNTQTDRTSLVEAAAGCFHGRQKTGWHGAATQGLGASHAMGGKEDFTL